MNKIEDERFKKELEKAKEMYFSWPKELYCVALDEHIKITRTGWDHIVNKPRRTKNQSYFRAKSFFLARRLIEEINFVQDVRVVEGNSGDTLYWSLQGVIEKVVLEVVIRQIGNQPKQFFSLVYKGGVPRRK